MGQDQGQLLQQHIQESAAAKSPLRIVAGGSKQFYGRLSQGKKLDVSGHRGIVNYQPSELVVTVRCGTPLLELEQALAAQGQMLPFEPPALGPTATVGGMLACGLSGPRRPFAGSMRDAVLGVRCVNGKGELLHFGGEVVKNVAGFDVSRLMVGALGSLGVILEVSLKLLPLPAVEQTLVFDLAQRPSLQQVSDWIGQALPISAASYAEQRLTIRLSGNHAAVAAARQQLGGDEMAKGADWWLQVREQRHRFFTDSQQPLWCLSLPPLAEPVNIIGDWFIDWAGGQRWLTTALQSTIVREMIGRAGGYATLYRGGDRQGMVFHPLPRASHILHQRLKKAFDPHNILNPGVLYPDI